MSFLAEKGGYFLYSRLVGELSKITKKGKKFPNGIITL